MNIHIFITCIKYYVNLYIIIIIIIILQSHYIKLCEILKKFNLSNK